MSFGFKEILEAENEVVKKIKNYSKYWDKEWQRVWIIYLFRTDKEFKFKNLSNDKESHYRITYGPVIWEDITIVIIYREIDR
jgi:hypothetical protein